MNDILERLDKLKTHIQEDNFLEGNGLSNEVPIHIFCYDPKDEMAVRYFVEQLVSDQFVRCHVIEKNLYKIFLKLCEEKRLLDKIPKLEETKGSDFVLKNLQGKAASAKNFVNEICKEGFTRGDVLMITGVGEVEGIKTVERFRTKFEDDPATFMLIDRATQGETIGLMGRKQ